MLCEKVYQETKALHVLVDKHTFFKKLISTQDTTAYISMITQVLSIIEPSLPEDLDFVKRLTRNVSHKNIKNNKCILFNKIQEDTASDNKILYLTQIYLWYLSLMAGGKIIKKYTDKEHHYLFDYTQEDKNRLKSYINNSISTKEHCLFIENVAIMYKLIKDYMDFITMDTIVAGSYSEK